MKVAHVDDWPLPLDRAVCLVGAPGDAIAVALDDLAANGPAVIRVQVQPSTLQSQVIDQVLGALTQAAIELFPAWLPEAATVSGHSSLDYAAIRIHARKLAARSTHYGPFLSDLAERSLSGDPTERRRRFSDAEVAEGLARVLGASWQKDKVALLVDTHELTAAQQYALASASDWLAARGFAVWLVDNPVRVVERVAVVRVTLPDYLQEVEDTAPHPRRETTLEYQAVAGRPHPGSAVERFVENELSKRGWAAGRRLNHPFQYSPIAQKYFLDIAWLDDMFIVELDGHEHFSAWRRARDQRRDEFLRDLGFYVLRIPNDRVLANIWQVIDEIEAALRQHRSIRSLTSNTLTATKEGHHP
ncbi:endonuclease domain-containing protein [Rhodococcoides yunnanense]|uniref:endonuclease domain-containing protein n=1 Tax=Rhodococcoides yunnanense TaxID=278209 RepID=UPI000935313A|nr:DUF559 domain-containing protein [Rhodococcus yunnanensis]